jgi:hypothetical protein
MPRLVIVDGRSIFVVKFWRRENQNVSTFRCFLCAIAENLQMLRLAKLPRTPGESITAAERRAANGNGFTHATSLLGRTMLLALQAVVALTRSRGSTETYTIALLF